MTLHTDNMKAVIEAMRATKLTKLVTISAWYTN